MVWCDPFDPVRFAVTIHGAVNAGKRFRTRQDQTRSNQIYFGVFLVVVLLRSNPSADEVIADGVCQRQVVVARRGNVSILHHGVVDVAAERLLDVGHVLDHGDAAHADLLASVVVGLHLSSHLALHTQSTTPSSRRTHTVDREHLRQTQRLDD